MEIRLLAKNISFNAKLYPKKPTTNYSRTSSIRPWFNIYPKHLRDVVLHSPDKPHLAYLRHSLGERLVVARLVIAYSRHPNIENLLSCRKICNRQGLKVSSFSSLDIRKPYLAWSKGRSYLQQLCCYLKEQGLSPCNWYILLDLSSTWLKLLSYLFSCILILGARHLGLFSWKCSNLGTLCVKHTCKHNQPTQHMWCVLKYGLYSVIIYTCRVQYSTKY